MDKIGEKKIPLVTASDQKTPHHPHDTARHGVVIPPVVPSTILLPGWNGHLKTDLRLMLRDRHLLISYQLSHYTRYYLPGEPVPWGPSCQVSVTSPKSSRPCRLGWWASTPEGLHPWRGPSELTSSTITTPAWPCNPCGGVSTSLRVIPRTPHRTPICACPTETTA